MRSAIYKWVFPFYFTIMPTRLTIDSAGRVVIPKPLRDKLELVPGDTLDLESAGESITLRPTRGTVPLAREQGVWVFRTGHPLHFSVTDDVLDRIRTARDQHNIESKD
jgi:AbrB family looped-hinge helix DNA binding protein